MSHSMPPTLPSRNPLVKFFVGVWNVINFSRRLVLNLLFLFLLFFVPLLFIMVLTMGGGKPTPLNERTTLVFAPEGVLVEEFSVDPASQAINSLINGNNGPGEVRLRDVMQVLEGARDDAKIERVLLDLDELSGGGFAQYHSIAEKLAELRRAGKQVIAWGESYGQGNYLLAAQADEVYADPMGNGVSLLGLSSYSPYLRELLNDKLGINVHVFKVGEFKSAVEPYVLDGASAEAKEADLYWMNDIWQRHVEGIASARNMPAERLHAAIDTLASGVEAVNGDMAMWAQQQGLLDGLKTRGELHALLSERGVADEDAEGGFRQVHWQDYLSRLRLASSPFNNKAKVAVVVAEGAIMDGEQRPGTVGGDTTSALLRQALEDDNVKAVVLRVNSPGGSAFASELINREVLALRQAGKPVVASMGHLAASGGYWISMNSDAIYADPSTITGSIGVFGMIPTLEESLGKIGVRVDGVATTRYADAFNLTRPMQPEVAQIIQSGVEKTYRDFISKVAEGRQRDVTQIEAVAQGRVWSGAQAKQRGLVDELGGLEAAVADAANRANLGDAGQWEMVYVEPELSGFARFLASVSQNAKARQLASAMMGDSALVGGVLNRISPPLQDRLQMLEAALPANGQNRLAAPVAYCFCDVQ